MRRSFLLSFSLVNLTGIFGFTSLLPQQRRRVAPRSTGNALQLSFPDVLLSQETIDISKNLLHSYESSLSTNPVATTAITSGLLATAGDAIAQASSNDEEYDYARGLCFLMFGAAYTGIFQHYWFDYLSGHIASWGEALKIWGPSRVSIPVEDVYSLQEWWCYFDVVKTLEDPPSASVIATAKLAVNQFFIVPSVYMPLFFAITGSLAKLDLEGSIERAQNMYIPLLKRNYFFWLPMQFVQFLLIPADWQILFISLASLLWTVILSSIATAPDQQQQQASLAPEVAAATVDVTDTVSLEDVENALIPQVALDVIEDPKFVPTTAGGVFGLLVSAANDGLLGGFVSNLLGATIGSGVAVITATGAVIGLITAANKNGGNELPETQLARQKQQGDVPELSPSPLLTDASPTMSSAEVMR